MISRYTPAITKFVLGCLEEDIAYCRTLLQHDLAPPAASLLAHAHHPEVVTVCAPYSCTGRPPNDLRFVLADCMAKRRLVENLHMQLVYFGETKADVMGWWYRLIRSLATPYEGRAGWDPTWKSVSAADEGVLST